MKITGSATFVGMPPEGGSVSEQEQYIEAALEELAEAGSPETSAKALTHFRALLESHRQEVERFKEEAKHLRSAREEVVENLAKETARAKQAERERDAAKAEALALQMGKEALRQERAGARADNAALLANVELVRQHIAAGRPLVAHDIIRELLKPGAHPGAALLREVEALKAFHEKVTLMTIAMAHTEDCMHEEDDPETQPCTCGKGALEALLAEADKARGGQ